MADVFEGGRDKCTLEGIDTNVRGNRSPAEAMVELYSMRLQGLG